MRRLRTLPLLLLALVAAPCGARAATAVELELVLAVDSSSSVTSWEFDLQMQGLSAAFRDPEVQGAIRAAGDLGIAVTLVQWSGRDRQIKAVEWTLVYDAASAEEFAADLDGAPRFVTGGSTAIGNAIGFAQLLLESNAYRGRRLAVDVSGDGRTNQGVQTPALRDAAIAAGITINGLAILNEDPSVDAYYRANVIGGSGAFLITATDYRDFARAMKMKLIREIGGPPLVRGPEDGPRRAGARGLLQLAAQEAPQDARPATPMAKPALSKPALSKPEIRRPTAPQAPRVPSVAPAAPGRTAEPAAPAPPRFEPAPARSAASPDEPAASAPAGEKAAGEKSAGGSEAGALLRRFFPGLDPGS